MKPYEITLNEDAYVPRHSSRRWSAYAKVGATGERRATGKTPVQALQAVLLTKAK